MKTCHSASENMPVSIWIVDYCWLYFPISDFIILYVWWSWFHIIFLNSLLISLSYSLYPKPHQSQTRPWFAPQSCNYMCHLITFPLFLSPFLLLFTPSVLTDTQFNCFIFKPSSTGEDLSVSKALKIHDRQTDRQRNRAKLRAEKRGVRGIDKEDRGGVQYSLVKRK